VKGFTVIVKGFPIVVRAFTIVVKAFTIVVKGFTLVVKGFTIVVKGFTVVVKGLTGVVKGVVGGGRRPNITRDGVKIALRAVTMHNSVDCSACSFKSGVGLVETLSFTAGLGFSCEWRDTRHCPLGQHPTPREGLRPPRSLS
jgi:hypothetical protein